MNKIAVIVNLFLVSLFLASCDCDHFNTYRSNYKAGDWHQIDNGFSRFNESGIPPIKQPAYSKPKYSIGLKYRNGNFKFIYLNNGQSIQNNGHTGWVNSVSSTLADLSNSPSITLYNIVRNEIKVQSFGVYCPNQCIPMKMNENSTRITIDNNSCRLNIDIKFFHIPQVQYPFWKCSNCY